MKKIVILLPIVTLYLSSCSLTQDDVSSSASGEIYGATEVTGTGIEVATWTGAE